MADVGARTHAGAAQRVQAQAGTPGWGIVDVILALIMLPFGVWMLLIDRMVAGIAWIIDIHPPTRSADAKH